MIVPTYEYLCQNCSYRFELKQSIKEDPVATCAQCGKSVRRLISAPAIMFKGSGWYVTDYSDKLKPPTGEAAESTPGPKKDATPDAGSTPAAPAAPSPAPSATPPGSTASSDSSSSSA